MNINRIIKDCFWDSDFSEKDIVNIAKNGSPEEKQFLFEKILINSTNLFADLRVFTLEDIEKLLGTIKIPNIKKEFTERRKNLIEVFFFDKPLLIEELKWQL